MSTLSSMRISAVLLAFIVLLIVSLWLRYQQRAIEKLRQHNSQLTVQSAILNTRLLQLKSETASLSITFGERQKQQNIMENESESIRKKNCVRHLQKTQARISPQMLMLSGCRAKPQ